MPGCAALNCSNSSKKGFHMKRFPRDPERRKQWLFKTKRANWTPTDHSYLCEAHFAPEMWEKNRQDGSRKLRGDAFPTIFSFTNSKTERKPRLQRKVLLPRLLPKKVTLSLTILGAVSGTGYMSAIPQAVELRQLIANSTEPLIFRNIIRSKLLNWKIKDWQGVLEHKKLEFRCGKNKRTLNPQWERTTKTEYGSFEDFLKSAQTRTAEWFYFDYKYLKDWFNDIEEIRNNLSWAALGFPEIKPEDCTMWIGSKCAHTCCHMDTYGYNLIFQIYGRKMWTVFPPEENLRPSRVPYEESSIYSKLNFFSPSSDEFKGIGKCRQVELKAGEVLLLPHKWWHYVENLETSISINVWLPHPEDDAERLKESIVQLLVKQISKDLDDKTRDIVLNPNMQEEMLRTTFKQSMELINVCKTTCERKNIHKKIKVEHDSEPEISEETKIPEETEIRELKTEIREESEIPEFSTEDLISKCNLISKLPVLSERQFQVFCQNQSDRFLEDDQPLKNEEREDNDSIIIELLNVLTDSEVLSLVKNKLVSNQID